MIRKLTARIQAPHLALFGTFIVLLCIALGRIDLSAGPFSIKFGGKIQNCIFAASLPWLICSFKSIRLRRLNRFETLSAVFFVCIALNVFNGPQTYNEVIKHSSYALLFYMIVLGCGADGSCSTKLFYGLLVTATAIALKGIINYSGGIYFQTDTHRVLTPLGHPNTTALFLAPAIILGSGLFLSEKKRPVKILTGAAVAIICVCLSITFTRTAWLACAAGFVCFAGAGALKERKRAFSAAAAAALVFFIMLSYTPFRERAATILTLHKEKNVINRVVYWKSGLAMAFTHPLTGIGLGQKSFMENYPQFKTHETGENPIHPHNAFIYYGAAAGLIAGCVFMLLLASIIIRLFTIIVSDQTPKAIPWIPAAALGASLCFFLSFLAECPLYFSNFMSIFWVFLAAAVSIIKENNLNTSG